MIAEWKKLWVLYDGRAYGGDTDDAVVYCCADSLKEARRDKRESFPDAAIYEYEVVPGKDKDELINERFVE